MDIPLVRTEKPCSYPHKGGLSCAVRTDKACNNSLPDLEADLFQRSPFLPSGPERLCNSLHNEHIA